MFASDGQLMCTRDACGLAYVDRPIVCPLSAVYIHNIHTYSFYSFVNRGLPSRKARTCWWASKHILDKITYITYIHTHIHTAPIRVSTEACRPGRRVLAGGPQNIHLTKLHAQHTYIHTYIQYLFMCQQRLAVQEGA